jgi:SAM-dependent methyltransferase
MLPQGAGSPVSVDHVWANDRVLLPSGLVSAACQLGGDQLGPNLAELAALAVVVGPRTHLGPGWTAVSARADLAPFPDASFDLVVVEDIGQTDSSPARVLDEARRLCRPTGTMLVGFQSGLERLRQRLPASLRSPPVIVLVALPPCGAQPSYFAPATATRPGTSHAELPSSTVNLAMLACGHGCGRRAVESRCWLRRRSPCAAHRAVLPSWPVPRCRRRSSRR